jgi:hypothetical protein
MQNPKLYSLYRKSTHTGAPLSLRTQFLQSWECATSTHISINFFVQSGLNQDGSTHYLWMDLHVDVF